jgi:hypothetical protein
MSDVETLELLERVAAGTATHKDIAALVQEAPFLGDLPFNLEARLFAALSGAELTTEQAILLSRLHLVRGDPQLARGPLARVLARGPSFAAGRAMLDVVAASGDLDCDDYLVPFVESMADLDQRARFAIFIAGSYHDHGTDTGKDEWIARAAAILGEERARRLFDAHFELGWRREEWLDDGFSMPE